MAGLGSVRGPIQNAARRVIQIRLLSQFSGPAISTGVGGTRGISCTGFKPPLHTCGWLRRSVNNSSTLPLKDKSRASGFDAVEYWDSSVSFAMFLDPNALSLNN